MPQLGVSNNWLNLERRKFGIPFCSKFLFYAVEITVALHFLSYCDDPIVTFNPVVQFKISHECDISIFFAFSIVWHVCCCYQLLSMLA